MSLYKVKKRNGTIVSFEREKIELAILKAMKSLKITDDLYARAMSEEITVILSQKYTETVPDVENIQDEVENMLMKS